MRKVILTLYLLFLVGVFQTGETKALFSDTGTTTESFSAGAWVNAGSVVVNELMWMGSTASSNDEWIELRNTIADPIDLTGWQIEGAGVGGGLITLNGTISANSFFLIMKNPVGSSSVSDSILANQTASDIDLDNSGEQLTLRDNFSRTIDQSTTGAWPAGVDGADKQSMERNDAPGDGTLDTNWHTCIDGGCNDTTFWDSESNNYGTPTSANLSTNDPTSDDYVTPQPQLTPELEVQVQTPTLTDNQVLPLVQEVPLPNPSPSPIVEIITEPVLLPEPSPEPIPNPSPSQEQQQQLSSPEPSPPTTSPP